MASSINLKEHMTNLYKAGVLDANFFTYIKLRDSSANSATITLNNTVYNGTGISAPDTLAVATALWQKGLVTFDSFPSFSVTFDGELEPPTEAEILRSQDTINISAHIFDSLQAESVSAESSTITVNRAFAEKWKVSTDDLLRYLPGVLSKAAKADRVSNYYSNYPVIKWTAAATLYPLEASESDLRSLFSLGLSTSAYLFWILQGFMELQSPVEIGIADLTNWGFDSNTLLNALSDLLTDKVITAYQANTVSVNWLKNVSTINDGELDYTGSLMSAEGVVMYQLWKETSPINPADFCTKYAITPAAFYRALKRIKSKNIIDFGTSSITLTWAGLYNPPDTSNQLKPPTGVTVSTVDSTKVKVTWTQQGTIATSWRVMYRVKDSGVAYSEKTGTSPCVVTGLTPSTQYEVMVYSIGGGDIKPSNLAYGSTAAATPTPTPTPTIPTGYDIWMKFNPGELQTNLGAYGPASTFGDNITPVVDGQRGNVVKLGDNSAFVFYNQQQPLSYTRSAWIKLEEYHEWSALFGAESGNEENRHNLMINDDFPAVSLWNNYDWIITDDTEVPLNTWTHVAATFDAGTYKLYVNGQLKVTQSGISYAPDATNNTIFIGLMGFGNAAWKNFVDEVVWYSRALTQAEVTQLYNVTTA